MESKEEAKANILKGLNKKLKIREVKVAVISVTICIVIGLIAYFLLFVKQTPISVTSFKDVSIERRLETINGLDDRELFYNHLNFKVDRNIWYSLTESNGYFYVENNDNDNSATLYFYISESYIQNYKGRNFDKKALKSLEQSIQTSSKEELQNMDHEQVQRLRQELSDEDQTSSAGLLLTPVLCKTNNGHINEVTKVYYLVYNYDNIKQSDFDKAKKEAVLLWEK